MNPQTNKIHSRPSYLAIVSFFTVSFWSSGVFLIRLLTAYRIWESATNVMILFILSLPLVYISILSVKKLFSSNVQGSSVVYDTLAGVLLVHGAALSIAPQLYALDAVPALFAAAWLLWFGGLAVAVSKRNTDY